MAQSKEEATMERLLANLSGVIAALVFLVFWFAMIAAIARIDQTTRTMLYEMPIITGAHFMMHDLVVGRKVKGQPRFVRAVDHWPGI
jgi:predicted membrane-bound spermidine synthase